MSWAALPVEPACMGKAVGEIRMRANLRKIVAYKDFAKQMVMAQYE